MYRRTVWVDHVVSRPNTYTETANGDGTVTMNPAFGTVEQQGTPVSATNLNTLEDAIQHVSAALDLSYSELQAMLRAALDRIEVLEAQVEALGD